MGGCRVGMGGCSYGTLNGSLSLFSLPDVLSPDQCLWFRLYYCRLSAYSPTEASVRTGSATSLNTAAAGSQQQLECRRLCAYNFPVSVECVFV